MAKKTKAVPQSLLGRAGRLLSAGSSILSQELSSRAQKLLNDKSQDTLATRIKQASQIVKTLGEMRGAAMKAGQLLSIEASDLLPPEVVEILGQLHDQATFMPFEKAETLLKKELGSEKFSMLQNISRDPIAAASIGQVHSAEIDGRKVAIKVQFPGIAKSIDTDLAILKNVVSLSMKVFGKGRINLDELFDEIKLNLKREVDYQREAKLLKEYREAFADDGRYIIPEVFDDFSTKRVLTMSFVDGLKLKTWFAEQRTPQDVAYFAELVIDLIIKEFFITGLVQTDPNYGNFMYRPKDRTLVLLDFGATKYYPQAFRSDLQRLMQAAYAGDEDLLMKLAYRMQLLDERESPQTKQLFVMLMNMIVSMFHLDKQPFAFDDSTYLLAIRNTAFELIKEVHYSTPAKQLIFLNRKLGGMYHILKDGHCTLDLHKYWLSTLDIN